MSHPSPMPTTAGHDAASPAVDEADGTNGTWAVLVSVGAVLFTFAASWIFFVGFLGIAALPGDVPPINRIPHTAATAGPLRMMLAGELLYAVAAVLAVVGLVAGIRLARRPDAFRRGVWAIALAGCTPFLAVMLLTGMGAT